MVDKKNISTILIPHFNNPSGLINSIRSIDKNEKIDIIVIDDGSKKKPSTKELTQAISFQGRLIFEALPFNMGIETALNKGIEVAEKEGYKYVARLDAGDLIIGNRFTVQEDFLEKNPDYGIVGSWVEFIDETGNSLFILKHPKTDQEIRKAIYRYNPFVHPSVMMRLDALITAGGYSKNYPALEDWACFINISKEYKMYNISTVFLKYEVSSQSISTKKRFRQSKSKIKLLLLNPKFNLNWFFGVIKSLVLLLLPRSILILAKRFFLNASNKY